MSGDINVQTFSGKVNITSNLLVGSSHLFVDTIDNRVGITTATPHAGLHVNSNAYVHTDFRVGSGIVMNDTAGQITADFFVGDGSGITSVNSDSGSWVNGTNSNVHLATSTDKVGIGVENPQTSLHVAGNGQTSTGGIIRAQLDDPGGAPYESNAFTMRMGGYSHSIRMDLNTLRLNAYGDAGTYGAMQFVVGDGTGSGNGQVTAMTIGTGGNVGIGVTDPDNKLEVRGNIQASVSDTNPGLFLEPNNGTIRRDYGGNGAGIHFTANGIRPTNYLGSYSNGGIDLGQSSYRWNNVYTEGLNASSTINLTTSASIRQDSTTWTGDPGTQGKLEYHDRKWYIVAGSNSNMLALFRRDGSDKSFITNEGNLGRINYSSGYLVGGQNNIGGTDTKTNPIYTIGSSHLPSDTSLGDMYGIGFSHGNFSSMLTGGWGLYVAADGDIRIGLNASNGIMKCTGYVDTPQIYMGSSVRQHLNLYGSTYGIGVQSYTTYFRSDGNFIFYRGGSHNNNEGNAGGGTEIANFNRNGWTYLRQNIQITGDYLESYNQRRAGSGSYPTRLHWQNSGHHIDCYYNSSGHDFHINYYSGQNVYLRGIANSDRRIKKNIKDINDASALETLRKLQPKTYEYKLKPERGVVYGFIAQEVKEVLPHATSVTTLSAPFEAEDFINATFEKLEDENMTVTLENPLNPKYPIQPGINLLFKVGPNETMDYKILEIVDDTHIIIDNDKHDLPTIQPILVGSQVNDFHGLEKDAIFTVATAALQEVDRQLQSEKEKVRNLESRVALLETGSKTNETIETIKTQLEVEKIKNSELQKKLELLEMSQMALVSRLEAIENM